MSVEAMKQALEALEDVVKWYSVRDQNDAPMQPINQPPEIKQSIESIATLRQAIEFAEMVEKGTKAWADTPDDWVDELRGGPEPYSQTKLELCGVCGWDAVVPGEGCLNCARLKQWLKQPEIAESERKDAERLQKKPEPVAWMTHTNAMMPLFHKDRKSALNWETQPTPLYTAPPKKEWAGLTGEEFDQIVPYCHNEFDLNDYKDFARAIEAKLKEKNT